VTYIKAILKRFQFRAYFKRYQYLSLLHKVTYIGPYL